MRREGPIDPCRDRVWFGTSASAQSTRAWVNPLSRLLGGEDRFVAWSRGGRPLRTIVVWDRNLVADDVPFRIGAQNGLVRPPDARGWYLLGRWGATGSGYGLGRARTFPAVSA